MEQQSPKFMRQRRFFLALPFIVFPFLTLLFWSLGGGSGEPATASSQGINLELPQANLGKDKQDKMSYYEQAMADSLQLSELIRNDPNYRPDTLSASLQDTSMPAAGLLSGEYQDPNEARVYEKLNQLDRAIRYEPETSGAAAPKRSYEPSGGATSSADIDRLERMIGAMNQPGGTDPEMQQVDAMMERILDIQHPERVQERLRQASESRKGQVFAVSTPRKSDPVSLLQADDHYNHYGLAGLTDGDNGFFSLDDNLPTVHPQNAVQAVVHQYQTVVNGSTVKLRLLQDVFVNGIKIPAGTFVFGTASLSGERLQIDVPGISYANSLFPVALSVYDLDGLTGIYIPGAITRDVAKQSADRSLQNIGISAVDGSWQTQAAGVGVEAAKSLFSKKVKLVKVSLKAGYRVLLFDEKQK